VRLERRLLVQMSRHRLVVAFLFLATLVAGIGLVRLGANGGFHAAASPDWKLLAAGFVICAAVQPLRALAWSSTVRHPVGFRAIYASSSIGSFLDTVLPGRLGEASKVAVLKVTSGAKYPGFSRAGGSLLCAHLLEMIAFAVLGAGATLFLPVPAWARWTIVGGIAGASGALVLAAVLHRYLGRKLPHGITSFLAGAAAPRGVLLRAGLILLATWLARWFGILFCLHAVGVHLSLGAALLETVQGRIDGAFREIEGAAAAALQFLDDPVAVRRLVGDDREQKEIEMSLERLGAHGARNYT